MRVRTAGAVIGMALFCAVPARAENHTFIIANNADGYGVDRCLATGDACGRSIAAAYCQSKEYREAISFHRVGRGKVTGSTTASAAVCRSGTCEELVAIECTR